jgi:hypothetical protein
VANKLVDDYYQGDSRINADEVTAVVEQLDNDFVFSERLVFLSKVRELNIVKQVPPPSASHSFSLLFSLFSLLSSLFPLPSF